MQMVFQDPNASLNPAMELLTAIGHPLRIHGEQDPAKIRAAVVDALERVGLVPTELFLHKYPSDLSGGQKQRAVIARAIILGPDLLVADEPVSMLDMSVRAKILELMLELKRDLGLSYVYVTHDLATAKFFCDKLAIMYLGRIVEYGPAAEIYADPKHPYTQSLLRAIPEPDPAKSIPRDLPRGEIPDAARPPLGCSFHPRCPKAFEICGWESRDLRDLLDRYWVAHPDDEFNRERRLVGDLDALDEPGRTAVLPAGAGHSGASVVELLERIKAEDPDEPTWSGITDIADAGSSARVEFRTDAIDPPLYDVGTQQVACLLYREENGSKPRRRRR
jgi:peptide/nickel transport system ATP-binding protein